MVEVGKVRTASGSEVSIHVMLGDVLNPKETHNDLGFDMVPVSFYFDPIRIDVDDVLIVNPLLNSALIMASRNEADWEYFMKELMAALYQNEDGVRCYSRGSNRSCEGDQIVPRIWPAHGAATVDGPVGVKYIAAIPLFDPKVLEDSHSPDIRRSLRGNLETGVIRERLVTLRSSTTGR